MVTIHTVPTPLVVSNVTAILVIMVLQLTAVMILMNAKMTHLVIELQIKQNLVTNVKILLDLISVAVWMDFVDQVLIGETQT